MESAYYGIKQNKVVRKIKHHSRDFPGTQTGGGKVIIHYVIFTDGSAGEFYQKGEMLKTKTGYPVNEGDHICFIPRQTTEIDGLDKLKMCDEAIDTGKTITEALSNPDVDDQEHKFPPQPKKPSVQNTAISFATRYATDCAIARFQGQDVSAEKFLDFISTLSVGLKDLMEKNV